MDENKIAEASKKAREAISRLTPEKTTELMKRAGIINKDGTLTEEYRNDQ